MIANTLHREILYALVPENVGQWRCRRLSAYGSMHVQLFSLPSS